MPRRLLTVEEIFDIPSWGGLVVAPGPLESDGPAVRGMASLKRPDGTVIAASLQLQPVFQTPFPSEARWTCLLKGVAKDDVPIGTEVWLNGV